jgi:hypothetical protein
MPRGGKRRGAGAPKGNLNALKTRALLKAVRRHRPPPRRRTGDPPGSPFHRRPPRDQAEQSQRGRSRPPDHDLQARPPAITRRIEPRPPFGCLGLNQRRCPAPLRRQTRKPSRRGLPDRKNSSSAEINQKIRYKPQNSIRPRYEKQLIDQLSAVRVVMLRCVASGRGRPAVRCLLSAVR